MGRVRRSCQAWSKKEVFDLYESPLRTAQVRAVETDSQNELPRNIYWMQKGNMRTYFPYYFFSKWICTSFLGHGCPHLVTHLADLCLGVRTEPSSGRVGSPARGGRQMRASQALGGLLLLIACTSLDLRLVKWFCKFSHFNQTSPQHKDLSNEASTDEQQENNRGSS